MAEIKVTFDDGTVRTFSGSVNRVEEDIDYVERPSSDGRWVCYRTGISLLTLEMTCFEKQEKPDPDECRAEVALDDTTRAATATDRAAKERLEQDLDGAIRRASRSVSKIPNGDPDMVTHWALKFLVRNLSEYPD